MNNGDDNGGDRDGVEMQNFTFFQQPTFYGNEIVANTRRIALMNMFLHNIGEIDGQTLISSADALVSDNGKHYLQIRLSAKKAANGDEN